MYLNRHESLAWLFAKDNALHVITRCYLKKQLD